LRRTVSGIEERKGDIQTFIFLCSGWRPRCPTAAHPKKPLGKDECPLFFTGWSYKDWLGPFYPQGLPAADYLAYYSDRFRVVEAGLSDKATPAPGSAGAAKAFHRVFGSQGHRKRLPGIAGVVVLAKKRVGRMRRSKGAREHSGCARRLAIRASGNVQPRGVDPLTSVWRSGKRANIAS
jgi:hypothetical protein